MELWWAGKPVTCTRRHQSIIDSTSKFKCGFRYRDQKTEEMITKTDWHNVAAFGPMLRESVMSTVSKGQRIHVAGRIMYGRIEDKAGIIR